MLGSFWSSGLLIDQKLCGQTFFSYRLTTLLCFVCKHLISTVYHCIGDTEVATWYFSTYLFQLQLIFFFNFSLFFFCSPVVHCMCKYHHCHLPACHLLFFFVLGNVMDNFFSLLVNASGDSLCLPRLRLSGFLSYNFCVLKGSVKN